MAHSGIQLLPKAGFLSAWKRSEARALQEHPELSCLVFPEGIQLPRGCSWAACRPWALLSGVNTIPAPRHSSLPGPHPPTAAPGGSSPSEGRVSDPKFLSETLPHSQHSTFLCAPWQVGSSPAGMCPYKAVPGKAWPTRSCRGTFQSQEWASLPTEIQCYLFNLKGKKRFGRDSSQPELAGR